MPWWEIALWIAAILLTAYLALVVYFVAAPFRQLWRWFCRRRR